MMGWRVPITLANTVIVSGPHDGVFVYSGTPGANKLLASITPNTSDLFGNVTIPGEALYVFNGTSWTAIALAVDSAQPKFAFYLGGATQASPYVLLTGIFASGSVSGGVTVWSALNVAPLYFSRRSGAAIPPAPGSGNLVYCDSNDALNITSSSGFNGQVPVVQSDTSSNVNANNATQPLTVAWTIPAGNAKAGTVYEIEVPFNGIFENQSLGFPPSLNGATVATSGGDTLGGAFFSLGQAFAGLVKLKVQILTTGAGGTANFFIDGGAGINGNRSSGTNNNNAYLSSQATGVAFNTTVPNTIAVNSVWGGSTVGQTVTGHGSDFTRKGP